MEPHWENSSSNAIVQDILSEATETTKAEIEVLISGGYVEKQLLPELTYTDFDSADIDTRQTYLWSALFSSGYLTDQGETDGGYYRLVIPNREVLGIYEKKIRSWFKVKILGDTANWKKFCMAVRDGEAEIVEKILNKFMADSISIRDTFVKRPMKENYYHGMLFGLLKAEGRWIVKSNAESGTGYTDIKISITHGSDSPQLAAFYKNAERSEVQANTPQLAAGKFISGREDRVCYRTKICGRRGI